MPDDHLGDALVARRKPGERKLLLQVLLERGLGRGELREIVPLVVVAARPAGRAVLVSEAVLVGEIGRLLAIVLAANLFAALLLAQRFAAFGWRAIRWRRRSRLVGRAEVGSLEEGGFSQVALQLLVELHRAQLQQPDGLRPLRVEGGVLRSLELQQG